jgi:hypothetical protein
MSKDRKEYLDSAAQGPSAAESDTRLEEYRTLREEILRRFNFRLLSIGYSNAVIGGSIVIVANLVNDKDPTTPLGVVHNSALAVLAFAYTRKEIEPEVPGLNWETWCKTRRTTYGPARSSSFALLVYFLGLDGGLTALCFILRITDSSARQGTVVALASVVGLACLLPLAQIVRLYGKRGEDYLMT